MPTVSIIVPVYKAEEYVGRCVESILSQTFQDLEIILVDDGSPDRSGAICDMIARRNHQIHVIHQNNQGVSAARNTGIEAATGEYIMFVDSDDVIHSQCVETLFYGIKETGAQIAIGDITRFRCNDMPNLVSRVSETRYSLITNLDALQMLVDTTAVTSRFTSPCCKLYVKTLFDHICFPVCRRFEDEVVAYQLYYIAEKCVLCDSKLYFYFVNEDGFTQNLKLEDRFDEYDAQWERLEYFGERNLKELQGKAAMTFLRTAQWDLNACRRNEEPAPPVKKQRFEKQYQSALVIAKNLGCLRFLKHYDYYVLAYPKYTQLLRIKRLVLRFFRKEV